MEALSADDKNADKIASVLCIYLIYLLGKFAVQTSILVSSKGGVFSALFGSSARDDKWSLAENRIVSGSERDHFHFLKSH